ncbi:MAG: hypothetical protein IPH15_12620 [Comamonadaceae bacterium]|nr:hypothetical protein [Comamonadaceae bacterium]
MTASPRHPSFSFHIESGDSQGNVVAASVLVQILQNAQQAFELIGVHVEGRSINQRARVSAATSQRFQLICQLPEPGCYALPVTVGGSTELFEPEHAEKAFRIFRDVMERVSARNAKGLTDALPDEGIRRRVLEAVKGMAPRADAKWTLALHDATNAQFAAFDVLTIPFVQETLVPPAQREASRVVTGELKNIDFIEHKLTIIYPPTNKELECLYDEALEDLLYERRRDLIQVTGRVLLDDQGSPKKIINVSDIRDVDLSPLEIATVRHGALHLRVTPALSFEPTLDEGKQLLCIDDAFAGLDVCVFAPTREALLGELHEHLAMLWQEYAQAGDEDLDPVALQLKQALLARMSEAAHAA